MVPVFRDVPPLPESLLDGYTGRISRDNEPVRGWADAYRAAVRITKDRENRRRNDELARREWPWPKNSPQVPPALTGGRENLGDTGLRA